MYRQIMIAVGLAISSWIGIAGAAVPGGMQFSVQIFDEQSSCCGFSTQQASVAITIWESETENDPVFQQTFTSESINYGWLSVRLTQSDTGTYDQITIPELLTGHDQLWVNARITASQQEVITTPRIELTSVPYAMVAGSVAWEDVTGRPAILDDGLQWADVTEGIPVWLSDGNVNWDEVIDKPTTFPPNAHGHGWSEIGEKPGSYPPATHTHDDRYYTETEVDALLGSKADRLHDHNEIYYAKEELNPQASGPGALDQRYLRKYNLDDARYFLSPGETANCRLVYSNSELRIVGRNGQPLDIENVCYVALSDETILEFNWPVTTTFGPSSDTAGNTFGSTAGRAWGSERPFFLAACDRYNGHPPYFGFSLNPARKQAGDIAWEGETDCDRQNCMLVMDDQDHIPELSADTACVVIGSFRATKTETDVWDVSQLRAGRDGFGKFQEGNEFVMPPGQNGAIIQQGIATHLYTRNGDGSTDVPTWSINQGFHSYTIDRHGIVRGYFRTNDSGTCTNGDVGSPNNLYLVVPYHSASSANDMYIPSGYVENGDIPGNASLSYNNLSYQFTILRGVSQVVGSSFSKSSNYMSLVYQYNPFM